MFIFIVLILFDVHIYLTHSGCHVCHGTYISPRFLKFVWLNNRKYETFRLFIEERWWESASHQAVKLEPGCPPHPPPHHLSWSVVCCVKRWWNKQVEFYKCLWDTDRDRGDKWCCCCKEVLTNIAYCFIWFLSTILY